MSRVRPAAVAGSFYPSDPQSLAFEVGAMLGDAKARQASEPVSLPKAVIVPHAGYVYSGPIAASAYARLEAGRGVVKRVVLLGPVHRVPVKGLALPGAEVFVTPLGRVPLDLEAMKAISGMKQVVESIPAHTWEHSLEVQLPFLQTVLGDFSLVPLAVGNASPEEVAEVLEKLWGGPETLIVISSDLSHYLPYHTAQLVDQDTAQAILALNPDITHEQACGGTPLRGLLLAAKRHALIPQLLDLRNSGDTAGDRSAVVGYAAFQFLEEAPHVH
ncbi:MAG: AmmeMemoRadiSam system protein B [Betaproteobacteria bacterium]|nr:AmmeMemoRadiSam system protein B [Betaproteobacteria bacterium]